MSGTARRSAAVLSCVLWLAAGAQPGQDAIPLNSERIEMRFGSYGIDVIEQDDRLRVSNLYSEQDGQKITRTFAVVVFPAQVPRQLRTPHAAILAGGSIGAVLAADGWQVNKHNRHIGTMPATPRLREMMRLPYDTDLAMHAYVLEVERDGRRIDYALIIEIHHPDYLSAPEIAAIYGPVPPLSAAARRSIETALERARAAAR